jgi:hypothetical protein
MDAAEALQELSRPWPDGDNTKSAIARVSRLVGLPYWRAFDIWYRKAQRFNADEAERIQSALQKRREEERGMSLQNSEHASSKWRQGWLRRTRTFIARTLISFANRCADLAQRAAPWISAP